MPPTSASLEVMTIDYTQAGIYPITVVASLVNYPTVQQSVTFTLTMLGLDCSQSVISFDLGTTQILATVAQQSITTAL
jgi:hypothetical protein